LIGVFRWWFTWVLLPACLALWPAAGAAVGANVTLQTGQGTALQRVSVPLAIPTNYPAAGLRFEVAFGTDEFIVGGEFVDSFTLTLRTTNRSHTVTLLTVDRFGATWLPGEGGGLLDRERDLSFAPAAAAPGTSNFNVQIRYTVLIQIPPPFLSQPSVLIATLFDNEDAEASGAVLSGLQIRPGDSSKLALESSVLPGGPYQLETAAVFDPIFQTITVPKAGARRLYRLRGETASRVTAFQIEDGTVVIDYEKDLGQPLLHVTGANHPSGPFLPVNNAVLDLNARKAFIPLLNAPAFFQITGSHPARIVNDVVSGNQRVLDFEIAPIPPQLETSSEASGPYATESGVIADGFARRLRVPVGGATRFYRIASDIPWVIRETSPNGNNIVIQYADP
jgi:hypothetical protein